MSDESKTDWSRATFRSPETRTTIPPPPPPQGDPPPRAATATPRAAAATAAAVPWVTPADVDFDDVAWEGVEDPAKQVLRALCRQTVNQHATIESLRDQNSSLRNDVDLVTAGNAEHQRIITDQNDAITNLLQRASHLTITGGATGGATTMQSGGLITDPDRFQRSPCARTAPFDLSSKTGCVLHEAAQEAISPAFDGKPVNLISFIANVKQHIRKYCLQEAVKIQDASGKKCNILVDYASITDEIIDYFFDEDRRFAAMSAA